MKINLLNTNRKLMDYKKSISCVLGGVLIVLSSQDYLQARERSFPSAIDYTVNWESYNGKVTDANGEPLIGVTIAVKGSKSGTVTDINGNFSINVPAGSTLVISYLGFETKEVLVGTATVLNIKLTQAQSTLDEVVFVGYGSTKKSDLVGSVASIKAEEIEDLPVPNIAAALRNRIPGVGVNTVSGKPGSTISINIRNSFKSDQANAIGVTDEPLYVIDGITVTREDFDSIDPSLVESISFLKDASAAIYGASGAKGVVLVTTKKGKVGKPRISYTGYRGVQDATSKPEMLSAYEHATLLNDGYRISGESENKFFSAADLEYLKNHQEKSWFDELWGTSHVDRHTINVSGGSEKVTFFAGGNYYDETGNYGGIDYTKFGIRSGMNANISDELSASLTLSTDFNKKFSSTYKNGGENDQSYFRQLVTTPRWVPLTINGLPVAYNGDTNPLAVVESGNAISSQSQNMSLNASINYNPKFIKGLGARFQFGKNYRSGADKQYVPPYMINVFKRTGNNGLLFTNELDKSIEAVGIGNTQLSTGKNSNKSYQMIAALDYGRTFGKHDFKLMVAFDQSQSENDETSVYWRNQLLEGAAEYWAFDPATFTLKTNTISESVARSYLGRLNYSFNDKYALEAIARYDASSNFAPENRWGLFPTVGASWKISNEDFFKDNVKFIDFLKLRVNYGLVGEGRVNERIWQDFFIVDKLGYLYNDQRVPGANPKEVSNYDITWEKSRTFNLGIDATALNGKLSATAEFYNRRTYDVFDGSNNSNLAMYAGFELPTVNYGERVSWGSEFSLGYRDKINRDWSYSADVNFGFANYRTVDKIINTKQLWDFTYPDAKYDLGTDPRTYNSSNFGLVTTGIIRTQAQLDAILSDNPNYTIDGKTPQVGWLYHEDQDGDGRITEHDQVLLFDKTSPTVGFGFNLGLNYKAFSLRTNLVLRIGGKVFYDNYAKEAATTTENVPSFWKDHWTPENTDAKFPRFDDPSIDRKWGSSFWAADGTLFRLNNATIAYSLPAKISQKLGLANVKALLTGNNLWTFINPLPYKDAYSSYIYDYPTLRTISLGLNVSL